MDGIFTTRFVDPYLRLHKYLYERTDGRIGKHSNRVPALLLTTTGRKSGLRRTNALTYCCDRGDLVVVASNGGSDRSPAWLHNVQADAAVTVRLGRRVVGATARVATPEERSQLWPLVNRNNRGLARVFHRGVRGRYDVYQRHTDREIPVVIIRPERGEPPVSSGKGTSADRVAGVVAGGVPGVVAGGLSTAAGGLSRGGPVVRARSGRTEAGS